MSTLQALLLKQISTASNTNSVSDNSLAVYHINGDIYVTGQFTGTLDIGGGVPSVTTTSTAGSCFLAQYSSTLVPTSLKYMSNTATTNFSIGNSLTISSSGDVYVTGQFNGTLDIGGGVPTVTTTIIDGSCFLAQYSSALVPTSLKYINNLNTNEYSTGTSIAVSSSGDVYVTGIFKGTLNIGGGVPSVTTITTTNSCFLAQYSSALVPTSLKYMSNTTNITNSSGVSLSISSSGDVYVTGQFNGTLDIGGGVPTVTTTSINSSCFLAKYSSALVPTSLKYINNLNTNEYSAGASIAVSSSGDVYVTGQFTGTLDIGGGVPTVTTTNTFGGCFLAKYSSTLVPTSLKYLGSTNSSDFSTGYSLAISSGGDVYVTGFFTGTLDIGGSVPSINTTSTNESCFLAQYSSTLVPISLKYIGGTISTDLSSGRSLAISSSGDVYLTGIFKGTLDIGNSVPSITNTSNNISSYIAKYLIILTTTTTIPTTTTTTIPTTTTTTIPTTTTTTHYEPICLVSGTPILTDQGIVAINKIDTNIHTISNKRIVAITKAITPEEHLICFEQHSIAINCPTKRTIMTPGHEVLYKGTLVQAKHFLGRLNGVHTVPYDGKVVYNVLLEKHGLMSVNNMVVETLHPDNKVAKSILNTL